MVRFTRRYSGLGVSHRERGKAWVLDGGGARFEGVACGEMTCYM